ncbi:MAG: hypothetical protein AAF823_04385 [Planctomycetota bacterium]
MADSFNVFTLMLLIAAVSLLVGIGYLLFRANEVLGGVGNLFAFGG